MQKNDCGIYCIKNKTTNKMYIGQSKHIYSRFLHHKSELNNNVHYNDYLQKAWNKYGENDFIFYVLEYCDLELLDEKEVYYIDFYNTTNRDFGYNLRSGGQTNNTLTEEGKEKLSNSLKEYYNDPKVILKRKENALRQWSNPEIKQKIMGENNGMYGRHHTEESRRKISQNRIGKPIKKRYENPVYCVELNQIFQNSVEASKFLNLDSSCILKVCRGERHVCGGYHWQFMENNVS